MTTLKDTAAALAEEQEYHSGYLNDKAAAMLRAQAQEIERLREAAEKLVKAKGRYHTQLAYEALAATLEATK